MAESPTPDRAPDDTGKKSQQEKRREKRKKQRDKKKQKDDKSNNGKSKWKGSKSELNGHVFQLPDEQHAKPNQFLRTVQERITFVKTEFDFGSDAAYILKNEELPSIDYPTEPNDNASKFELFKWEQNYKR